MFQIHKQFFIFIKTLFPLKYIAPNLTKINLLAKKSGLGIQQRANNLSLYKISIMKCHTHPQPSTESLVSLEVGCCEHGN
jgi:hypothetical protein